MDDERLEHELRELFRADAPAKAPIALRLHASELPRRPAPDRRPALLLIRAAGAAVVVVALVVALPRLASQQGSPPATPSAPNTTAASPMASPSSPTATDLSSPAGTVPPAASGWSYTVPQSPGSPTPLRGPDGTTYLATAPYGATGQGKVFALDSAGRPRTGWPFAPAGVIAFGAPAVSPDGTVYVAGARFGTSDTTVWALDPSGEVRPGWPYAAGQVVGFGGLLVTPDGGVAFVEASGSGAQQAVELTAQGTVRPGWPVALPGDWTCYADGACAAIGADGTWYALVAASGGDGSEIVALRADGLAAKGWPVPVAGGEGFLVRPDGAPCAWGYDIKGQPGTSGGARILRTRLVCLAADGSALPGWPVTLDGPAGIPAVGRDGTLYLTAGTTGATERVLALGPDGVERAGWPVPLPDGIQAVPYALSEGWPARAASPVVGVDGRLLLPIVATGGQRAEALLALSPTGTLLGGWPVSLPSGASLASTGGYSTGSGAVVDPVGAADGTTYLAVVSRAGPLLLAFGPTGSLDQTTSLGPESGRPTGLVLEPDAGLVATVQTVDDQTIAVLVLPR